MLCESKYFRISVTNRCNLSCQFCHREGNYAGQKDEVSPEEIQFACKVAYKAGFRKFKITGGEPTERADLCVIISLLSELQLPDLSMITNGTNLASMGQRLWDAGLRRINVTVNTLNPERFQQLNPQKNLSISSIVEGIETARRVGFNNIKINFVFFDEDSVKDLKALITFIKEMEMTLVLLPVIGGKYYYSLEDMYNIISSFGISSEEVITDNEGLQKRKINLTDGGSILLRLDELAEKQPYVFCRKCTKVSECREGIFPIRLSANGKLIPCMADTKHRICVSDVLHSFDEDRMIDAFQKIALWRTGN